MDAIRLGQINEALGYDRSMNAMVFNIEKKRVARYPDEEVIPESQITEEMEDTAKEQVNALRVILDNKQANVAVLPRSTARFQPVLVRCERDHTSRGGGAKLQCCSGSLRIEQ